MDWNFPNLGKSSETVGEFFQGLETVNDPKLILWQLATEEGLRGGGEGGQSAGSFFDDVIYFGEVEVHGGNLAWR